MGWLSDYYDAVGGGMEDLIEDANDSNQEDDSGPSDYYHKGPHPLAPGVKYRYKEIKEDLLAASKVDIEIIKSSTNIVRSSTHEVLANQIEAKRARLLYKSTGSPTGFLYRVRLTGNALVRDTVEYTKAELVSGTNKIRDIDTKFIYNSTNARAYCTQEHDRLKYGDFTYTWSSPDNVAVGSRVALQMTSPYPNINTLVQVKSKTKTKDRPLYNYSGVATAEFNLATILRQGELSYGQTQMNYFLDQSVRGNVITISASDYYYPANRRCDGTADEVEINDAIDKLDSESSGGTVVLSPGTFYLNAAITPTDKIVITGAGAKTVLDVSSDITGIEIVSGEDNVMIKNLTIQYSGGSEIEKYLIDSEGNTTQVIGCAIDHPGSLGVSLGGNRCKLIENDFTGGKSTNTLSKEASVTFNSGDTGSLGIAMLNDSTFVVAFQDQGDSNKGKAIIGTISGTTISYDGSETVFNNDGVASISVCSLDATHFVVAYNNGGDSSHGYACVGVVSGSSITFGSQYEFNNSPSSSTDIDAFDATHFVIIYLDDTMAAWDTDSIVGVVSNDDEVAFGSIYEVDTTNSSSPRVACLDATHCIVVADGSSGEMAKIGTLSNDDELAYGTESVWTSSASYRDVMIISATKIMIGFQDYNDNEWGKIIFGDIDGTDITFANEAQTFRKSDTEYIALNVIGNTHFTIVFSDKDSGGYGYVLIGTILGEVAYFSDPIVFEESDCSYLRCDENIVCYDSNDTTGESIYLNWTYTPSYCIKSDGNNNIIGNNTIHGSTGKYIEVGVDSAGDLNTIANNTIDGDGQNKEYILHGINIRDDSNNNNVSSNNISGVEKVAVVMQGSNNKVSNIMAKDNGNLIDRGDCQAETSPMVEGETTPDTSNVTWERVAASDESITGYAGRDYVWKFTISSGGTQARIYMTDTLYTTADMHGLVPGLTYKGIAQVYTKATGGVAPEDINVSLIDSDGASAVADTCNPLTQGAWEEVEVELTLRDDATGVTFRFRVEAADAVANEYFYVGDVRLEPVGTHTEHDQQMVDYGSGTQQSANSWQNPFPA